MRRLICILLFIGFGHASALADKRVALVIGNGSYKKVASLPNPLRDAAAMADLFRKAGFSTVQLKSDLSIAATREALRAFSYAVQDADIAVVFYAGHGMEVNGTNYLIPVDAKLERDLDIEDEAVSLDRINQILEPAKRLRLVILDACRDNPFTPGMKRTLANRSIGRGLARVEIAFTDSMVAFAAKPGAVAADGRDTNSPYTKALIKHLATPGLDLRLAMGRVRDEVLAETDRQQEPIVFTSLGGAEVALIEALPGAVSGFGKPSSRSEIVSQDRRLVLSEKGLGPFTKNSAVDLAAIRRALPEYDVKLDIRRSEGLQSPRIHVTKAGKRVLTLEGENGHVSDIIVFSPDILDVNSMRVGMRFGDLPKSAIRKCFTAVEENSDKVICENSLSPTLQYWLVGHKLNVDGDTPVPINKIPADAKIWAIRWVPILETLAR